MRTARTAPSAPTSSATRALEYELHAVRAMQLRGRGFRDDRRHHARHQPIEALEHRDRDAALARGRSHFQADEAAADDDQRRARGDAGVERRADLLRIIERAQAVARLAAPAPGTGSIRKRAPVASARPP